MHANITSYSDPVMTNFGCFLETSRNVHTIVKKAALLTPEDEMIKMSRKQPQQSARQSKNKTDIYNIKHLYECPFWASIHVGRIFVMLQDKIIKNNQESSPEHTILNSYMFIINTNCGQIDHFGVDVSYVTMHTHTVTSYKYIKIHMSKEYW